MQGRRVDDDRLRRILSSGSPDQWVAYLRPIAWDLLDAREENRALRLQLEKHVNPPPRRGVNRSTEIITHLDLSKIEK